MGYITIGVVDGNSAAGETLRGSIRLACQNSGQTKGSRKGHPCHNKTAPFRGFLFVAERVGWALRARACRCAAAPVEQGLKARTALRQIKKRGQTRGSDPFSLSGGEGGIRTHGTV